MAINKVEFGGQTLIDLTNDTVTPEKLMAGETAHDRSGASIVGTATGSGGHVIQNDSGTNLTQRDTLQFKGRLKATDDSTNGKTVVDDSPEHIEWDDWCAMTPQQQAAVKEAVIDNAPGVDAGLTANLLTKLWENPNPTSSFASQNITLSSDDYDMLLLVYRRSYVDSYSSCSIALKGNSLFMDQANASSVGANALSRTCAYLSSTSYSFSDAVAASGTTAFTVNNDLLIPVAIYGIKKTVKLNFSAIVADVKSSIVYSTDEQVIGTWIDGKPLYQKTWNLGFDALISSTSWYLNLILDGDIRSVIKGFGTNSSGVFFPLNVRRTSGGNIDAMGCRVDGGRSDARFVTLQYTRTSDYT